MNVTSCPSIEAIAGPAGDAPVAHLLQVVLAQRDAGDAQVLVGRGRAEVGGVARDPHDALPLAAAHSSGASSRRSSAPNSVYHCQSEETPSTTFWIT